MRKPTSRLLWAAALLILAAALVYYNIPAAVPAPAESAGTYDSDAPEGHAEGERLPDFTLTLMNGSEFRLSDRRGRVTVINLWATWCGPCVGELPHFDRLLEEHADDVSVLAIHSDLITDDVAAFLADHDYRLDFAVDESGEIISALGGSTMLPQTIVLDRYGVVTYNKVGSVTYELLDALVASAMTDESRSYA